MAIQTLTPSGSDNTAQIQKAIDDLKQGDLLQLNGNFKIKKNINLKSNLTWRLNGTITLADKSNTDMFTNFTQLSNISMSGGTYDGNMSKQRKEYRIFELNVKNSSFSDMICMNSGKGFGLSRDSTGNTMTAITGKDCGNGTSESGNGLADRGDHNTWTKCIAENNWSDNFIIKCRDSTFYSCIARNGKHNVGFGMYTKMKDTSTESGNTI